MQIFLAFLFQKSTDKYHRFRLSSSYIRLMKFTPLTLAILSYYPFIIIYIARRKKYENMTDCHDRWGMEKEKIWNEKQGTDES